MNVGFVPNTKRIMSLSKPYKRTVRQFTKEAKKQGGLWHYIQHEDFAESPEHYVRAFLIILKDFKNLLDYVEPSDINLPTYSFRIHELLLRICIEIEANFVAILKENGYSKAGDWKMSDYKKVNVSHRLSYYEVKLPVWNGVQNIRRPFEAWENDSRLPWWNAYNKTKHNRHTEFERATFENLTNSICALITLLSAQFEDNDFAATDMGLSMGGGHQDGMESTIGGYFRVKYPDNWPEEEKYGFLWSTVKNGENPITTYSYE
ncbi:MAG: hypothetical protein ABJF11_20540 [Reichenbachiella sp.]|uniref:hypothetical protein n=1 Tax=Reichenbachiella sp. TaxID=2184521 RepID=UPI0032655C13